MDETTHRPRVVVVGSYAVGLVMRSTAIPAPGETVIGDGFQAMDGGKGSNQAVACARLGTLTTLIAAVGTDAYGARALELLTREGVDTTWVRRVPDVPTGVGFIIVDAQGNNAIAVDLGANRALTPADIERAEPTIAAADVVLTQGEIPMETALRAMQVAHRHGVRTIFNPAPATPALIPWLGAIDVLTPNLSEAQMLCGLSSADPAVLGEVLRGHGARMVVITVGDRGAWLADEWGGQAMPAFPATVVDTTGAGDAFSAALAVGLASGFAAPAAVRLATAAGAYAVRSLGTVPSYATMHQVRQVLDGVG